MAPLPYMHVPAGPAAVPDGIPGDLPVGATVARTGCPRGCWSCTAFHKRPLRTRLSTTIYRRTSFPFRVAFRALEAIRRRKPARQLGEGPTDDYIQAHARYTANAAGWYGYHRVFDLMRNFHPTRDPATLKVLSIGPRTEIELYHLWLFSGFSWGNLTGLDIVSASPKIQLGDISVRIPFADRSFDVIVASHVLEKSRNPERTRDEILRIARPGASILVSGDRPVEGIHPPIPVIYFRNGAYGFIQHYGLSLESIPYLNARSPHGFEIIFRV